MLPRTWHCDGVPANSNEGTTSRTILPRAVWQIGNPTSAWPAPMLGRAQAPYGCWYSAGFSPAFPSTGRFYPRCDPHTSANAICLIYKRIILHGKVSDSYRGPKTVESREAKGRWEASPRHFRNRPLRRRSQSEFLKRSEDCLSDWTLPKSPDRAKRGMGCRQSGQTLWRLQPDPFPNLRNCYHRPCSHYPQGRTQHAHT